MSDQTKFDLFRIMEKHGFSGELNPCVSEMLDYMHKKGWRDGVLDATGAAVEAYSRHDRHRVEGE